MKDIYSFLAIFTYDEDGISIEFPDLPGCFSCSDTEESAINMAKEALALHLYGMETDNDEIPNPSLLSDISLSENQVPILIDVYMPMYRTAIENQSVKKTLTIPMWLNKLAEEKKINFSQVLQIALKDKLGINEKFYK